MSDAQSASLEHGSGEQYSTVVGSVTGQSAPGAHAMSGLGAGWLRHSQFFGHVWSPHVAARAAALTAKGATANRSEKLSRTQGRRVGMLHKFAAGPVPASKIGQFAALGRPARGIG
jgi:hypothetical protein